MKQIWILMGIIGAGKSTKAKEIATKHEAIILSSDELRKEFIFNGQIPEKYDSKYNPMVFAEYHKRIELMLIKGKNVVIDSTNIPSLSRKPIIEMATQYGYKIIGEVLLLDDAECKRRILHRQSTDKTSHVINDIDFSISIYKKRLEEGMPTLDEGFHQINVYNNGALVSADKKVLIATSNAGKVGIYGQAFDSLGIKYCSLKDLSVDINVEENGKDELENAFIKARAYHQISGLPVLANDSGLIIERLPAEKQPGLFVRRNNGKELTDIEMLNAYIEMLNEVGGESEAHYNVGLAIIDRNGIEHGRTFKPARHFIAKPSKVIQKGIPLSSLCFDSKSGKYMSEMTMEERNSYEGEEFAKQKAFIKEVFCN